MTRATRIGSLFSGIGGLELGLERAGLGPVVWQCELSEFCRSVLAKHWPDVQRFKDVTRPREYPSVDLICGGFPCQDVSSAGKRRGLGGERSGLWYHFARVVRQVRPSWVVVENVASGARAWLPTVRRDLHVLGYDTTAVALSAFDVGAPHLRRRIFVIASDAERVQLREQSGRRGGANRKGTSLAPVAGQAGDADAYGDGDGESIVPVDGKVSRVQSVAGSTSHWATLPEFRRVDDGASGRLHALGNAVVPQCAEVIGRMILEAA